MSTVAEVRLWGSTIGAVALDDAAATASFEYDRHFAASGIEGRVCAGKANIQEVA